MILGGRDLFEGAGRAVEFEDARIALNNQAEPLGEAIALRLTDRLVGVCLRLGIAECQALGFWEPIVPAMVCVQGFVPCVEDRATIAEAIMAALGHLPPEALDQLAVEAAARATAQDEVDDGPPLQGSAVPRQEPAADDTAGGPSWKDRLARILGGDR
jgi:phospholipid/cholesterol/gamma-HCH transport system substrate-binding protein